MWKLNLILLLTFISGNATSSEMPSEWGSLSKSRVENSECPLLVGIYSLEGKNIFIKNGLMKYTDVSGAWIPFWHPVASSEKRQKTFNATNVNVPSGAFVIHQSNSRQFNVFRNNIAKNKVEGMQFNADSGDFICSDGVIQLTSVRDTGYSEGVGRQGSITVRIMRSTDGAIIYHQHTESKVRKLFFLTDESISEDYYQFTPMANK